MCKLLLVYFSKVKIHWTGDGNENITFREIDNVEICSESNIDLYAKIINFKKINNYIFIKSNHNKQQSCLDPKNYRFGVNIKIVSFLGTNKYISEITSILANYTKIV